MMEEQPITSVLFQNLIIMNVLRYFLTSSLAFVIFYVIFKQKWQPLRIQLKFPERSDYHREITYSLGTILIFAIIGLIAFIPPVRTYNLVYDEFNQYGWLWWGCSILLMLLIQDTYFYWMHRAMHHRSVFKLFHLAHHKSTNPSPWASYAFHPLEAIVEASVIFPIILFVPFHRSALVIFLTITIIHNVYVHLGYEILPKRFHLHPIGKWINTSINHNMHHTRFDGNYGLYFLFWDRWLGTIDPAYDQYYEETDNKRTQHTKHAI